jgi:uncharacterized membrane protein (TIGR02234 family)
MADRPDRRRRTSFAPTVIVGLAAAGLATVAATQTWATATTRASGVRTVAAEGTDVAPAVLPLALVALAAWGTVLVLRRRGRRVVAVLGLLASCGAAGSAVALAHTSADVAARVLGDASDASLHTTAWPFVTVGAALVAAGAFVVAFLRAPQWPEMSARYDAPGDRPRTAGPMTDTDLWKALDAGDDPTVTPPSRDGSTT